MALADMLSALRVIVLDDFGEVPQEAAERKSVFAAKFPALSPEELDDLVRIPAGKFGIYTGTIFAGERSVLKRHFPISVELLLQGFTDCRNRSLDGYALAKELHRARPWDTNTTIGLARNFLAFITEDCADIVESIPWLPDIAALECVALELRRELDSEINFDRYIGIAELETMHVAELLSLSAIRPRSTRLLTSVYDVATMYRVFHKTNQTELIVPIAKPGRILGSRREDFTIRWLLVSEAVCELLESVGVDEEFGLSELAEAFLSESDAADEAAQFRAFFALLCDCERQGALVILKENSLSA